MVNGVGTSPLHQFKYNLYLTENKNKGIKVTTSGKNNKCSQVNNFIFFKPDSFKLLKVKASFWSYSSENQPTIGINNYYIHMKKGVP